MSADQIAAAYNVLAPYIRRTPVVEVGLSGCGGAPVILKLEQLQVSGSFKARGAFANLLLRDVPPAGVVAASGGNHGVAVAYAAHRLGVPAAIFVPTISAPEKVARIRALGADLVVAGERYHDALMAARAHQDQSGALAIHAFDQRETLLGQGSLALELRQQFPDLDTVLVPVGGGGLIGGIAAFLGSSARIVGVEPDQAPTLTYARKAGRPTDAPAGGIAADALAPRRVGELVFPIVNRYVDEVVLVDEDAIVAARNVLWSETRMLVEPAAAVGAAALLSNVYTPLPDERVAIVLTGANCTPAAPSRGETQGVPTRPG